MRAISLLMGTLVLASAGMVWGDFENYGFEVATNVRADSRIRSLLVGITDWMELNHDLPNGDRGQDVPDHGGVLPVDAIDAWEVVGKLQWVAGNEHDEDRGRWPASEENMSILLNGPRGGGIWQSVATIPGRSYVVTFDLAGSPNDDPTAVRKTPGRCYMRLEIGTGPARLTRSGYTFASFKSKDYEAPETPTELQRPEADGYPITAIVWERQSLKFTAKSSETTVILRSLCDRGFDPAVIDNVHIEELPEHEVISPLTETFEQVDLESGSPGLGTLRGTQYQGNRYFYNASDLRNEFGGGGSNPDDGPEYPPYTPERPDPNVVPEPASMSVLGVGLVALLRRRKG